MFLDSPYSDTGLAAYYDALGENAKKWALSDWYGSCGIPVGRIARFAEAIGAQTKLEVKLRSTDEHPLRTDLQRGYQRVTRTPKSFKDEDWMIPQLQEALPPKSDAIPRLIWNALRDSDKEILRARFRPSCQYTTREQPSSLVLLLREASWVPQRDGRFVRPADASRELLPEGFPSDKDQEWLKAVRFGEDERQQSEEHKKREATARELGFVDEAALLDAQQFAKLPPEQRRLLLDEQERRSKPELPEHNPRNPDRRAERVLRRAADDPERLTEMRMRSVSIGREEVKAETEPYLRELYTNADGEMICQVCQDRLPFKLDDGSYYVEKVEFLPELQNRHYQNYLALCPNHAAMYRLVNDSSEVMKDLFMEMAGNKLEVILAQQNATIYFTGTHAADLRAVIAADQSTKTKEGGA